MLHMRKPDYRGYNGGTMSEYEKSTMYRPVKNAKTNFIFLLDIA